METCFFWKDDSQVRFLPRRPNKIKCVMNLLKTIIELQTDKNAVQLFTDPSCEMAKVLFNGECIFEGNYWDFHPGCYGDDDFAKAANWFGNRPENLALAVVGYLQSNDKLVERLPTQRYQYSCNYHTVVTK